MTEMEITQTCVSVQGVLIILIWVVIYFINRRIEKLEDDARRKK